jgi:3-hydroxyisobutyrate dehydrogenase-like beta-hydroxyacid dehydrogenase
MSDHVGIFGLGLIGCAAAQRLIAAGHAVTGYDPDSTASSALVAMGGRAGLPADVWSASKVLIAVFDAAQARAVLATAPEAAHADVMILTTCDPEGIASLLPAARTGLALIEAPISGTSAQLRRGEATLYLAGAVDAIARLEAVLYALTDRVTRLGPFGEAARVKLAINLILGLNRAALAEGLLFARAMGLDPEVFLGLVQKSAAGSSVMASKGPRMVAGDFSPEGRVSQSAKDFRLILHSAEGVGLKLPFTETYLDLMEDLIAEGSGGLDNSAVILALELGSRNLTAARKTST